MNKFQKLVKEIIALSDSNDWDRARLEWHLKTVYMDEELDECLCSHYPIKEICVIANKNNGNEAIVGNICVKKFLGLSSDRIFQAVKRIQKDNTKSLNIDAIEHAYEKGWINKYEYGFSIDTMRKRELTANQLNIRLQVNKKMIRNMQRSKKS